MFCHTVPAMPSVSVVQSWAGITAVVGTRRCPDIGKLKLGPLCLILGSDTQAARAPSELKSTFVSVCGWRVSSIPKQRLLQCDMPAYPW